MRSSTGSKSWVSVAEPEQFGRLEAGERETWDRALDYYRERLIAGADERARPLIVIALKTGMRRGELLGLRWDLLCPRCPPLKERAMRPHRRIRILF